MSLVETVSALFSVLNQLHQSSYLHMELNHRILSTDRNQAHAFRGENCPLNCSRGTQVAKSYCKLAFRADQT